MANEKDKTGRCGWIALGFVFVLLQALLPVSLTDGLAAFNAGTIFSDSGASDLFRRMLVLAGMITGLLLSAVSFMLVTMMISRMTSFLFKRPVRQSSTVAQ
jgi:hypothetical protein